MGRAGRGAGRLSGNGKGYCMTRHESEFDWTEERVEKLKRLTNEGLSCSAIGLELGVSRNAIIGKQHRTGFRSKKPSGGARPTRRYTRAPWAVPYPGGQRKGRGQFKPRHNPGLATDLAPEPALNPVGIFELKDSHCRWPVDGGGYQTMFCGDPAAERQSYCPHHCCVAYTAGRQAVRVRPQGAISYVFGGAKA